MKPKDLDKRADKILSDIDSYGNMMSEWKLNLYKDEITNDYNQVKEYCSTEYTNKVNHILSLLDKLIRNI